MFIYASFSKDKWMLQMPQIFKKLGDKHLWLFNCNNLDRKYYFCSLFDWHQKLDETFVNNVSTR